jgi:transcriptional regulator with XRE-family HTH domain
MSFGHVIVEARRKRGLSQKELASRIRKEDGSPISPQYLNDLERDRRNPPSDYLLQQFAAELAVTPEYLFFVAGQYPTDLRPAGDEEEPTPPPDRVQAAFRAFRRALNGS